MSLCCLCGTAGHIHRLGRTHSQTSDVTLSVDEAQWVEMDGTEHEGGGGGVLITWHKAACSGADSSVSRMQGRPGARGWVGGWVWGEDGVSHEQ